MAHPLSRRPLMRLALAAVWGLLRTTTAAGALPAALPDVIAKILPGVVTVETTRMIPAVADSHTPAQTRRLVGAGFIIDADGTIVTNLHVIAGTQDILVTLHDGTELAAALAAHNAQADVALLSVHSPTPLVPVRFGDSNSLRVGDTVIAVGNPYGLSNTVSTGIVSALNRNIAESDYDDYIQTDAAINHGNSGGPLFNMRGEVIGINSVIFAPGGSGGSIGLGFAMPSNDLRFVTSQLRRFGYLRVGYLGIAFQDVTQHLARGFGEDAGRGRVVVTEVLPDTPAAGAGFAVGDVVLRFGGVPMSDSRALARAIAEAPIGQALNIAVWRFGAEQRLTAHLTEAPHTGAEPRAAPMLATAVASTGFGLTLAPLSDDARQADAAAPGQMGVLVTKVAAHQAAADAGLQAGDVIVMAQRRSVGDPATLMRILHNTNYAGGVFVPLLVLSHGRFHWVALAVQSAP